MAVPDSVAIATDAALLEAMTTALPESESVEVGAGAWDALKSSDAARFTAAVIGPGMGTGAGAGELVDGFLREFRGPLVIDADGLNVLALAPERLRRLSERSTRGHGPAILTPHPGEMARLMGISTAEVQQDRLGACRTFARAHNVTVVLKGAATVVSDGERVGFNTSGNAGMASPGMGDVLAGVSASFACRIDSAFTAASLAAYVHGLSADLLAMRTRGPGFLASEVADAIPGALAALGTTLD
jgi:NAD(P)H-hydrate epimerase